MDLIDIKNKSDLEQQKRRWWYFVFSAIGFFLFLFLMNNINADYYIFAEDGNVNVHFDTNGGTPTMNLNINQFDVNKSYINYSANLDTPTVNPIILGLELIFLLFSILLLTKSITMFGKKNP